jgi:hypothetical protein
MNLLIPYVYLKDHDDPLFREFTYGDVGARGTRLLRDVHKGDYAFFHTSIGGKKYITAYYVTDRVMITSEAVKDKAIACKYQNPHITECLGGDRPDADDVLLFGDPITSRILDRPLHFDKALAEKLSLKIPFPKNRTETQSIGSATRPWRVLTDTDRDILLAATRQPRPATPCVLKSIEEVAQVNERDIEDHIANNPSLIGPGLKLKGRQVNTEGRLDLIFEDNNGNWTVVELKLGHIGRETIHQIDRYLRALRTQTRKKVEGVIVCAGLLHAYEKELRQQTKIRILVHGWDLKVQPC